ncbi:MAG: acyltransferase [Clostridia bacterium]|nr:acyltransferase [Clostridia bacterium]
MVRQGELSKTESTQLKGLAILFMVLLHLFCRKTDLPYSDVTVWGVPLSYFFGLFGDQCVTIYCFCSGYAHCLLCSSAADMRAYIRASARRLLRFLLHFWIVVLLFAAIGLAVHSPSIPQSVPALLGNLFLYRLNYNGAWWFVLTYCILTALSPLLFRLCRQMHPILLSGAFLVVYFVAYVQRFKNILHTGDPFLDSVVYQLALLGTSIFPYMIGMMFYEHKWISALRSRIAGMNVPTYLLRIAALLVTAVMIVLHRIVESLFVAVFIGTATVVLFAVVPRTKAGDKILLFFGGHSTNIWLTHMFFYLTLFRGFVFIARWPIPIYLLTLTVCVGTSYVLRPLQKGAQKLLRL